MLTYQRGLEEMINGEGSGGVEGKASSRFISYMNRIVNTHVSHHSSHRISFVTRIRVGHIDTHKHSGHITKPG
jgi:hypothetical protein